MTTETATELNDLELIRLVAEKRSDAAFSELFRRYHRAAYSLALNIVNNESQAEDVAQHAMVKVWTAAGTFKALGSGALQPWILKIVARESFKVLRRRKVATLNDDIEALPTPAPAERAATEEALSALRSSVERLPELERQLISLHFGAGLSQREISRELSMPQQTISYRITQALKSLRGTLTAVGSAGALAMPEPELLTAALTLPRAATPNFEAQVLSQVKAAKLAGATTALGMKAAAVFAVCAAGAGGWALLSNRDVTAPPQMQTPAVAAVVPLTNQTAPQTLPADQSQQPTLKRGDVVRYTFEKGASPALNKFRGVWEWQENSRVMRTGDAVVLLPIILPRDPVRIRCSCRAWSKKIHFGIQLGTTKGTVAEMTEHWKRTAAFGPNAMNADSYLFETYQVSDLNRAASRVVIYPESHEGKVPVLVSNGLDISEIEIRVLSPEEIPAEFRRPKELTKGMTLIPRDANDP